MRSPRWARWLVGCVAPAELEQEVVGDIEESFVRLERRHGRLRALFWTSVDAVDMAASLLRIRLSAGLPSLLDLKLGFRMLARHPGLTLLGGLSMAFAIFVGATGFELFTKTLDPRIPLPDGDRIVSVELWNAGAGDPERRILYDIALWRAELRSAEHLTVFRTRAESIVTEGVGTPVVVAEMDPSGFELAGVAPILGRTLTEQDAAPQATPVAVIGHDVWADRLVGDPDVLGSVVQLGADEVTVVGVMPEGFSFPMAHDVWIPFVEAQAVGEPLDGPPVRVLAKRTRGSSIEDVQGEIALLGTRMSSVFPASHEYLRPMVQPLAISMLGIPPDKLWMVLVTVGLTSNLPVLLFLVLVCGNVALLMFARASSREQELVVRGALGASRSRIVTQLFAEALVLSGVAAAVGLFCTQYGLAWVLWIVRLEMFDGGTLPFWLNSSVGPRTIIYAAVLAVVAAVLAGAWPGLRVTRDLGERLKAGGGGGASFRFGGVWTFVIAGQILVMMLFPLVTYSVRDGGAVELVYDPTFELEEYAVGLVPAATTTSVDQSVDSETGGGVARRIGERMLSESGVAGVAYAERLPMTYHPWQQIEVDGPSVDPPDERGHRAGASRVDLGFFDLFHAEIVEGRGFHSGDLAEGARSVIVDDAFVERVLGPRPAVGMHLRYLANESFRDPDQDPGPWFEIVGVVEEIGARSFYGAGGVYHAVHPEDLEAAQLIVHAPAGGAGVTGRLRSIATEVDPTRPLMRVSDLVEATREPRDFYAFWTTLLTVVSGFAMLLSMAGIYAVMSFTVAKRTREIGIRVALGSSRGRVVQSVFKKPLAQVALGLGTGGLLLLVYLGSAIGTHDSTEWIPMAVILVLYMVSTSLVCAAACAMPTIRALRIEPQEALRVDG